MADYAVCPRCGCVTANPQQHEDWHTAFDGLEESIDTVEADVVDLKDKVEKLPKVRP